MLPFGSATLSEEPAPVLEAFRIIKDEMESEQRRQHKRVDAELDRARDGR